MHSSEVELLKTFKGIGDYSAIGLMLEIQAVERFATAKKLASFFGLHPIFKIVATYRFRSHEQKRQKRA